jgi:hypothetical protein
MLFTPRPKGLGKENFLRLNDQEEATGIFRGEIYTFKQHWVNGRGTECTGSGCQMCASDPDHYPAFRFRVNFIQSNNGQFSAKIFEGGGGIYDSLVSLEKKFDLSKTIVDIARSGTKKNTKYQILPRVDMPVTQELESRLRAVPLLQLSTSSTGKESGAA